MMPTQIYAQKRSESEDLIRQHSPESSHAELIALLRLAIALNATLSDDAQIPLGASKFGGAPDVPADFVWPTWKGKSLTFLAQINLAEVASLDIEKQLPCAGVLLFFVMLDEESSLWELWDGPEQRDGWRVVWAREPLQRIAPPDDSHWIAALNTHRVSCDASWVVPQDSVDFDWTETEWSHFTWDVLEVPAHRMLTCPYAPQLSPLAYAANGAAGKSGYDLYDESVATDDWILLLQLDTGAGDFFDDIHDVGWLYFMMRREDLAKGDFSNVWLNEQCT